MKYQNFELIINIFFFSIFSRLISSSRNSFQIKIFYIAGKERGNEETEKGGEWRRRSRRRGNRGRDRGGRGS